MRLLSIDSEIKALRTICGESAKISAMVMASVSESHFYYKPAVAAYKIILKALRNNGDVPDWNDVVSDPAINEDSRKILKTSKQLPVISREKATSLVKTLDKYRKLRGLLDMAKTVMDSVEDKEVDLDELIEATTNSLTSVRAKHDLKSSIWHIGKGNNSVPLIKETLYGKKKPSVPTGFKAFDERNGGILDGSLFTIGANTGGGKSSMAVNLLRNMTEAGFDTVLVPLEMTASQTAERLYGILTGIEVNKISQKRLSVGEKKVVKKAYRDYVQRLKQIDTRYSIWEPEEDMTIEETLLSLKPHGYKVILIDYISLLKGADGEDQWRQLGNIARFAKVFAKNNNCIVVLLCQVSEEGKIRYAQAIAEHSNNCWIWTMPGDDSETSIMEVNQMKARNQLRFRFSLLSHNPSMRIGDMDDTDLQGEGTGEDEEDKELVDVTEDGDED